MNCEKHRSSSSIFYLIKVILKKLYNNCKKLLPNRARYVILIVYLNLVQNNLVFTQNKFLIFSVILFNETIII